MTRPRLGSLCTGYGGLDAAVEAVFGTTTAWCSDIDPGAALLRAREPLAEWLDHAAHTAHWAHGLFADSETPDEFVQPHALAVARAITGSQP